MRGYFSNIARHIGLFFSRNETSPAGPVTSVFEPLPLPRTPIIERDDVVTVPSSIETSIAVPAMASKPQKAEPEVMTMRLGQREVADNEPVLPQPPAFAEPAVLPNPVHVESPIILAIDEKPHKAEIKPAGSETHPDPVEQAAFIEQSVKSDEREKKVLKTAPASEKQPESNYFARTAEVLGGKEMEPATVQTILLRETQEWIAAGPTSSRTDVIEKKLEPTAEPIQNEKVVRMIDFEPDVTRIGEKHKFEPVHRERISELPGIEEQVLDLSIGTINVVIEGDKKPPQPAPSLQSDSGKERQISRRGSSRLSRSYI